MRLALTPIAGFNEDAGNGNPRRRRNRPMSADNRTIRCIFCHGENPDFMVGTPPEVVCGKCIEGAIFTRAAHDAKYRERMVAELSALPEPEPWECCDQKNIKASGPI
jgi:hypothetical protein